MTTITKADGTVEEFDPKKLIQSLERSGAASEAAQNISRTIEKNMGENMPTHEIYHRAFEMLREHRREAAARYSLKRAILEFGPSGFPFESYLAELFRSQGYEAAVDQHIQGLCVEHEVDVVLDKGDERVYIEAKFHNTAGFKTDLQVALYVQARLEDIEARLKKESRDEKPRGILATNTKFTSLAIAYGRCRNLGLLGWEYPAERNLHDMVYESGLFPITVLTTLSSAEKVRLLAQRVVLCRDLTRHEDALARAGVQPNRMNEVLDESASLCGKRIPMTA